MSTVAAAPPAYKKRLLTLKKEQLRRNYPKLWLAKEHHINVHGKRMIFGDRYRFLVALYKELSKVQETCYRKSVQCGISELLIVSALEEAMRGLRILYVMPNIDLRGKFVRDRLDRLLKSVEVYRAALKESVGTAASVGLKHFGKGILNFVGSNSTAEFTSFPADALYEDEVDSCDQKNLDMAPDRLDASDYKLQRKAGNPSVEKWGIDAAYQESSQGRWFIQCEACNEWQPMDFFKSVVRQVSDLHYELLNGTREEPQVVCVACSASLQRLSKGEWVHKYNDRAKKGYHISQLFSANVTLASLVDTFYKSLGNAIKTQLFYNSKLGIPYSSAQMKITIALLRAAEELGPEYALKINEPMEGKRRVYIGVDVGKYYHLIARELLPGGFRRLIMVGRFETTRQLVAGIKKLNAKVVVIDEEPEVREVETIKKQVSTLFSCAYSKGKTILDIRRYSKEYKKERRFKIDRTFALDAVRGEFAEGKVLNPNNSSEIGNEEIEEYGEYWQHMLASSRVFIEEKGRFEWRESGPDHFFHAEAYCKLAEEIDDRILDYYTNLMSTVGHLDKAQLDAKERRKGELIPKDKRELELMDSQSFLKRVYNRTEEVLGQKKSPKTRSDVG